MRFPKQSIFERATWLVLWVLVVFFARFHQAGLSPDAAFYAGLSRQIFEGGDPYLLAGVSERFQKFFEHPPFFFQWGAIVLSFFGMSDGAARAIGAIPASAGVLVLLVWVWRRCSFASAAIMAIFLGAFSHFIKFASTSLLEAPLSLASGFAFIALVELHWRDRSGYWRPVLIALAASAVMIATASKGVAGLGVWGAMLLGMFFALFMGRRSPEKVFLSIMWSPVFLLIALAPFAFWYFQLKAREGGLDWIENYFTKQVVTSFLTNRGEDAIHSVLGDRLYYLKLLLRDAAPLTVLTIIGLLVWPSLQRRGQKRPTLELPKGRAFLFSGLAFLLAYGIPFSISRFQLPHYLHPAYAPMAVFGSYVLGTFLTRIPWLHRPKLWTALRWILLVVTFVVLFSSREARHQNRGQEFAKIATQVAQLPKQCTLIVRRSDMDPFRMEAFSLWYLGGRKWVLSDELSWDRLKVWQHVRWNPASGELSGSGACQI